MNVDRAAVTAYRAEHQTWAAIAATLGVNANSLRRWAGEHDLVKHRASKPRVTPCLYPEWTAVVVTSPPHPSRIPPGECTEDTRPLCIPDENCLAVGDLHIPYHNADLLQQAIDTVRLNFPRVRRIVFGGDLFDFAALSAYPHNQLEAEPNAAIRLGGRVLRAVLDAFDEAVIMPGNHDERLARKLDKAWDFDLLINAAMGRDWPDCRVQITNVDYVQLGARWLIGHPANYSGRGGQTPSDLADLWQRNIVTFHNHIVGMQPSKSGHWWGVDAGHCTLPERHTYAARRLTKYTRWQAGFVVISDGYPWLFPAGITDWRAWGLAC